MQNPSKFIVFDIVPPHTSLYRSDKRIEETVKLLENLTGDKGKVIHIVQQKTHPNLSTFMGTGKIEEVKGLILQDHIDCIVLNDIVKPGQIFDLTMALWHTKPDIKVWDRVDLILQIFRKNAHTAESKLQIELAAMRHMGPRIFGMGMVLSRQGGGVGTRGLGETNTERMKRHWREEIRKTEDRIKKLQEDLSERIRKRKDSGVKTVALVGYTNAGKTSLFNALTRKEKLSKDMLFATLDSATGYMKGDYDPNSPPRSFEKRPPILITDTIGFMQGMPPSLVKAFSSTLTETKSADLILHIVDSSDKDFEEKIDVVENTLKEIGSDNIPSLLLLNKMDEPPQAPLARIVTLIKKYHAIPISTRDDESLAGVRWNIRQALEPGKGL
ncbi:MAG: GTPase HflX [Patescibacteria group bacterium]